MVLIETNNNDHTTSRVIEWFKYFDVKYYTLTPSDTVGITLNQFDDEVVLTVGDKKILLDDISGYWFRRGLFSLQMDKKSPYFRENDESIIASYHYSNTEKNTILQYLHYLLGNKKSINSFLYCNVNKLIVINEAVKHGLLVPKHLLTSSKEQLLDFFTENNNSIITKVCSPASGIETSNYSFYSYTQFVDKEYIDALQNQFFNSYFQENINKSFEIRCFLLNGNFYNMAIFSQESEKTSIDFRNYDWVKPNRQIPYTLPREIEVKLKALFTSLNLNSGSADLIYSREGQYYFLEINPVGQFGMVSYPCNYYLEREIALYFKN